MARQRQEGPVAETVATNLRRLRDLRGLTAQQLADKIASQGGGRLRPDYISLVENRRRSLTLEEALLVAVALDVTPAALLMPDTPDPAAQVTPTPSMRTYPARTVWLWLTGRRALEEPAAGVDWADMAAMSPGELHRYVAAQALADDLGAPGWTE